MGATSLACAQPCAPTWGRFPGGDLGPGLGAHALAVYDDGRGPGLYIGGNFTNAGNILARSIVRWDGQTWSSLPDSTTNGVGGTVYALTVYDDGGGPKLYVAGQLGISGGLINSPNVARWDGNAWAGVGGGTAGQTGGPVYALEVFDEGSGPKLFVGGDFTVAGGQPAARIARWDGVSWSALGAGVPAGSVRALLAHDDGSGAALYVGGSFAGAGGVASSGLARWRASGWSAVGLGMGSVGQVSALRTFDDGSGAALYAGGSFTSAGGGPANYVARWRGDAGGGWSAMGAGPNWHVKAMRAFDDGSGPALYAVGPVTNAGPFSRGVARWDGTAWSAVGEGLPLGEAKALAVYDEGRGPAIFVGLQGSEGKHLAKWKGQGWSQPGSGANGWVHALAAHDNGSGASLHAAGIFTNAGDVSGGIVRKGTDGWERVATVNFTGGSALRALASFDAGAGPVLYAGGHGVVIGGVNASLACYDGNSWTPVGTPPPQWNGGAVHALHVHNDGFGQTLIVGGAFSFSTSTGLATSIARWDGSSWSALGTGLYLTVLALATFDDGSGPRLYAGGDFHSPSPIQRIARWDGTAWSTLGTDVVNGRVFRLHVHDDGSGPALYVGGEFSAVGAIPGTARIARWDGHAWSSVGGGITNGQAVTSLGSIDEGSGPLLYAGVRYTSNPSPVLRRWDGSAWSVVGTGLSPGPNGNVQAMVTMEEDGRDRLYLGGGFTRFSDESCMHLLTLGCDGSPCYANCDASSAAPVLNVADFTCFLQRFAAGDAYANCDQSTAAPVLNVADFTCFLQSFAAGCH